MKFRRRALTLVLGLQVIVASCTPAPPSMRAPASTLLRQTWEGYKRDFILGDGRVVDYARNRQTTSEGQAYAMLRAVWMNDRTEFDLVWRWTQSNLQVRGDKLFGYLWGPDGSGTGSLLSRSTATDADEDIALALIFAGHRWRDAVYLKDAHAVLADMWEKEVTAVQGRNYLTAGDWAPQTQDPGPVLNPSYFTPYAYRIFAREDPSHAWGSLVDSSYRAIRECSRSGLQESSSVGLPPNWCALDRTDGSAQPYPAMTNGDSYSYDAFRVMWRVALDYEWYHSRDAKAYLEESRYLRQQWKQNHRLASEYAHDGGASSREDPTIYGGDIGNFLVTDPGGARAILDEKLLPSFRARGGAAYWGNRYNYFEQNWVWFGVALAAHQLPNLAPQG